MPNDDQDKTSAILTRRSWLGCSLLRVAAIVPVLSITQRNAPIALADGEPRSVGDGKLIVRTGSTAESGKPRVRA